MNTISISSDEDFSLQMWKRFQEIHSRIYINSEISKIFIGNNNEAMEIATMVKDGRIRISEHWRKVIADAAKIYEKNIVNMKKQKLCKDKFDNSAYEELRDKVLYQFPLMLTEEDLVFSLVLIDYISKTLLNNKNPFTEEDMEYFKEADQYMAQFNTYSDFSNQWEIIRNNNLSLPDDKDKK